ncbi:MAG: BolA family transcriptional regulator [Burkholderiales bacterium]|nr:BolA family transcriptional regulator [Burkholderiales bacterium]
MNTIETIQARLAVLNPSHIEIQDDSASHAGHAGAKSGGGHFFLTLVSEQFAGQSTLARHRKIYALLGDLMHKQIHALSIKAQTPDEFFSTHD